VNSWTFTYDAGEDLSITLVEAIEWAASTDVTALTPLTDVIDPDALNDLFTHDHTGELTVAFQYEGYAVTVTAGEISIRDASGPSHTLLKAESPSRSLSTRPSSETHRVTTTLIITYHPDQIMSSTRLGDRMILVGDFARGATTQTPTGDQIPSGDIVTIPEATDLATLGIQINEMLSKLARSGGDVVVHFDSIETLLDQVGPEPAFKFLHVLTGLVNASGATGYYYLDPEGVTDKTISTMEVLFDHTEHRSP